MITAATKSVQSTLFSSVSVADTDGLVSGQDLTITAIKRNGDQFILNITEATEIGMWHTTTPAGYFVRLTDRSPTSTISTIGSLRVDINNRSLTERETTISLKFHRNEGKAKYIWQSAPVMIDEYDDDNIRSFDFGSGNEAVLSGVSYLGIGMSTDLVSPMSFTVSKISARSSGTADVTFQLYSDGIATIPALSTTVCAGSISSSTGISSEPVFISRGSRLLVRVESTGRNSWAAASIY